MKLIARGTVVFMNFYMETSPFIGRSNSKIKARRLSRLNLRSNEMLAPSSPIFTSLMLAILPHISKP